MLRITSPVQGRKHHSGVPVPTTFVVVDTSAAVEVLVGEAECRDAYLVLFDQLQRDGFGLAYSEAILPELLEAAYTWDSRRSGDRDWRRLRREGLLWRPRARELSILSDWQSFTHSWRIRTVGLSLVAQHAAGLMADTGLSSLDAIHLATALHVGAGIVSHDRGLLRVAEGYTTAITMRGA